MVKGIYWYEYYEEWKLWRKAKNDFEKDFKLMNNSVCGKTMESVRKHWGIKLVTTEIRKNYLVSESNYHTAKFFFSQKI